MIATEVAVQNNAQDQMHLCVHTLSKSLSPAAGDVRGPIGNTLPPLWRSIERYACEPISVGQLTATSMFSCEWKMVEPSLTLSAGMYVASARMILNPKQKNQHKFTVLSRHCGQESDVCVQSTVILLKSRVRSSFKGWLSKYTGVTHNFQS